MATISRERKQLEDTLQHGGAGIKTFTGLLSEGKDEALALGRSLSEGNFREAGSSLSGLARAGTEALKSLGPMGAAAVAAARSEEHTSELQSLMRNSYAVFCLKKKKNTTER